MALIPARHDGTTSIAAGHDGRGSGRSTWQQSPQQHGESWATPKKRKRGSTTPRVPESSLTSVLTWPEVA